LCIHGCVLSLSRWCFGLYLAVTGIHTHKEPTGQNPLSVLEPSAVILDLVSQCQYSILDVQHLISSHGQGSVSGTIPAPQGHSAYLPADIYVRVDGDGGNVQLAASGSARSAFQFFQADARTENRGS
jgi:hypothetical protein